MAHAAERFSAVLFDMDGTLVESHAAVERAWLRWADEHGVPIAAVIAVAHGLPAPATVRHVLPHLSDADVDRAARRQLELQYDDLADVTAAEGAGALLRDLRDRHLPWAVVTSADRQLALARLGAADIDPPCLVTVEDVHHGKPAPDGYLLAAARLGVRPDRCLVVEDTAVGVAAGRAAGCTVAGVRGATGDVTVAGLVELSRWLLAQHS